MSCDKLAGSVCRSYDWLCGDHVQIHSRLIPQSTFPFDSMVFVPNWFVLYVTSESAWWRGRISWACSRSYDGWGPRLFQTAGVDRHGLWPLCRTSWTAEAEARTAAGTMAGWGEVHPLGSPEGHPGCDEEADWLRCGLGTTPCCRESHGWAAGAAYSFREVGREGQGLPAGQVSVPLQSSYRSHSSGVLSLSWGVWW